MATMGCKSSGGGWGTNLRPYKKPSIKTWTAGFIKHEQANENDHPSKESAMVVLECLLQTCTHTDTALTYNRKKLVYTTFSTVTTFLYLLCYIKVNVQGQANLKYVFTSPIMYTGLGP